MTTEEQIHWYAVKVFWRRTEPIKDALDELGVEYFAQNLLPSYMFIRTDANNILKIRDRFFGKLYLYADRETKKPSVIPDKELETFRIVCSSCDTGLEFLGDNPEKYMKGDKVHVLDGPFKGAEGYVIRIKKDRRLVVTISGLVAVATSFIPMELLEKVE